MRQPIKNLELEAIAQATAKVLKASGKAMASQSTHGPKGPITKGTR